MPGEDSIVQIASASSGDLGPNQVVAFNLIPSFKNNIARLKPIPEPAVKAVK